MRIEVDFSRKPRQEQNLPVPAEASVQRSFDTGSFGADIRVQDGSEGHHLAQFLRKLGFR